MIFLKNITPEKLLKDYWEKEHLFLPASFEVPKLSFSKEEILDLALDEDFETRLITQSNNSDWNVNFGPLADLSEIEKNDKWTLFIHNFNLYEKYSNELQSLVKFIPTWLFDDVLCSLSSDGSTVGAHFDRYNVFILQISGKRSWKIQKKPSKVFRSDCPIKVLENFTPDVEYTLCPGDMIFIPPECGHEGTSIGESISLSIGFKSLEAAQIFQAYASEVIDTIDETEFHKTSANDFKDSPFEISKSLLEKLHGEAKSKLNNFETFKYSMLNFLTTPKNESYVENENIDFEAFCKHLSYDELFFIDEIRYIKYENEFWINQNKFELGILSDQEVCDFIDKRFVLEQENIDKRFYKLLFKMFEKNLISFSGLD